MRNTAGDYIPEPTPTENCDCGLTGGCPKCKWFESDNFRENPAPKVAKIIKNKMLDKIKLAAQSRTVWTIVLIFVVNGIVGIKDLLPESWLPVINSVLSLLAIYFRVSPRV